METEKEQFRGYLEKSGLTSCLTDMFVKLYEETERPQNALDYLRKELGTSPEDQEKISQLEKKVKALQEENSLLKAKLQEIPVNENEKESDKSEDKKV